jgi:nitroreductase
MTEHATPDAAPNTTDLFEIMRTTRSMRRLKPDLVPNELIRKILEAGVCAPSGGKNAKVALPRDVPLVHAHPARQPKSCV